MEEARYGAFCTGELVSVLTLEGNSSNMADLLITYAEFLQ